MDIKEIIKTYGKYDYYEMSTGKLYRLSEMEYSLYHNKTIIPVTRPDGTTERIGIEGNLLVNKI